MKYCDTAICNNRLPSSRLFIEALNMLFSSRVKVISGENIRTGPRSNIDEKDLHFVQTRGYVENL